MNYARVIDEIFSQFDGPKFSVKLWNGHKYDYGKGASYAFTLVFSDENTVKQLLSQGALGFGEAYMEGRLRVEGDLEAYIRLRHQFKHVRRSYNLLKAKLLSDMSVPRNRKDQIAYHYDLGNDFFQMILDQKTMSYSAGRYRTGSESLSTAQQKKIELICGWLDLPAGAKVLDLGFGWGGFAKHAAQKQHWDTEGYTLSKAQLEYCRNLAKRHKLERQLSFKYKDMLGDLPGAQFDAIVMVESIEHVGKARLADYFKKLHGAVKPGGSLYIQSTGHYKPRSTDKWIQKYVFPGYYLPSIGELIGAAGEAGFRVEQFRDDTPDYLYTLTEWIVNLESHRPEIERLFGEPFYRLWELWMHGAKVAFEVNYMNLFRVHFRKS